MSKLVERVVAKQVNDHIHDHNLDNRFQSAYKTRHSTETALLSIKNQVHLSLSRGEATALVLLDLSGGSSISLGNSSSYFLHYERSFSDKT